MAKPLDKVGRVLYRSLLRHARTFDERPALKALICRGLGAPLPEPLDAAVAGFLGGPGRAFFWPAPAAPQSVASAVRQAFRSPAAAAPAADGAFQALRYLSALLNVARNHEMLADPPPPAQVDFAAGAEQPRAPERGTLLVAHPCLPSWFSRTVVLICDHSGAGSFGLCVNKPFGGSVLDLISQGRSAGASALSMDFLRSGAVAGAGAGAEEGTREEREGAAGQGGADAAAEAASERPSAAVEAEDDAPSTSELLDFSSDLSDHGSDGDEAAAAAAAGEAQQAQQDRVFEAISHVLGPGSGFDGGGDQEWRQFTFTLDEESAEELLGTLGELLGEGWESRLPEAISELSAQAAQVAEGLDGPQREALMAILEELQGLGAEDDGSGGEGEGNMPFLQPPREESTLLAALGDQPPPPALAVAGAAVAAAAGAAAVPPPAAAPSLRTGLPPDAPASTSGGATTDGASASGAAANGTAAGDGDGPASPKQLMAVTPRSLVYLGGPVAGVNVLHAVPALGGAPVAEGAGAVRLGVDASLPQAAAALGGETPQADPGSVCFFLGSSQWTPGQLEEEIARGSWAVVAPDGDGGAAILELLAAAREGAPEEQQRRAWQGALGRLGPAHAALAAVPEGAWADLAALEV